MKLLFILSQYLVPQHLLSRLAGKIANAKTPWLKHHLIIWFIKRYGVNMAEAANPDPAAYACFNDFFTRALKAGVRPVHASADAIISPADGVVSAAGSITADRLIQAKGKSFSLTALLGGDEDAAYPFQEGSFVTVYLSPKDYHRVHMPCAGTLKKMIYIPGRLFSVNQTTGENINNLFARNERIVCVYDTDAGPMALVLVGAMIVAAIETVWAGLVAPAKHGITETEYDRHQPPLQFARGDEMGRFRLGSTVVVLFGPKVATWLSGLGDNRTVRMGEAIGAMTVLSNMK
jgi:phosphatidylserine decarboxylase